MSCRFRLFLFSVLIVIATAGVSAAKTINLTFSGKYYLSSNHATTGTIAGTLSFDNATGQILAITISRDGGTNSNTANCPSSCTTSLNYKPPLISFQNATPGLAGMFFITQTSLVGLTNLTPAQNPGMGNGYGYFLPNGDPICGTGTGCTISAITYTPRH